MPSDATLRQRQAIIAAGGQRESVQALTTDGTREDLKDIPSPEGCHANAEFHSSPNPHPCLWLAMDTRVVYLVFFELGLLSRCLLLASMSMKYPETLQA